MPKIVRHNFKSGDVIPVQELKSGMVVKVHQKIKELNAKGEEKERIQVFEGTVMRTKSQKSSNGSFMVRKTSDGIGVERTFPNVLPTIEKIVFVKQFKVRQAKANYLRDYTKKLKIVA